MRILVVGNGGREHALAWRLAQDPGVTVRVAPGNALVEDVATLVPVELTDIAGLVTAAATWPADLVVVGPEAVLAAGLSDALAAAGITVLGPSQAATRIEASKSFARELMEACRIPMARGESFDDPASAIRHVEAAPGPVVIKADGLAKGKGVVLPANRREAARVIERFMVEEVLGAAGRVVVIEEALRAPTSVAMLKISGKEIMDVTHEKPGPKIGFILNALLEEVLENPDLNNEVYLKEKAIELIKMSENELKALAEKGKKLKEEVELGEIKKIRGKYKVK